MDENGLYHGWLMPQMPEQGICWRDASESCFKIYGLIQESIYANEEAVYERLPQEIAVQAVSQEMPYLARATVGGRLRFKTDSGYIALRCYWDELYEVPHMTAGGTSGFDLYLTENGKSRYYKTFMPPRFAKNREKGYRQIVCFPTKEMRDVTIYFPVMNHVKKLEIGLEEEADIMPAEEYRFKNPVVYYGSSITNGACASRPGNTYESFISRTLNLDQRNMGFSDSAKGDVSVAQYIAGIDMCAFVFDYDHNAPDAEWLARTHYPFYETIRKAKPDVPIICISRPRPMQSDRLETRENAEVTQKRKEVILDTIRRAKEAGDTNIYFIDGETLFDGADSDCCTVDGCHPNDLGFHRMAQAIIPVLAKALHIESYKE